MRKVEDTAASSISTLLLVVGVQLLNDPAPETKLIGLGVCGLSVASNYLKYSRREKQ